jgi:AcrR family transcriptional regulator
MQDICAQAGLSPGAVYRYFGGKEEIIEAMVEERRRRGMALVEAARHQGDTAEILDALSRTFFAELEDAEGCAVGIELWAEALRSPRIREMLRDDLRQIRASFAEIIAAAKERGDVDPAADPEAAAQVMLSLFEGFVIQRTLDPGVDAQDYVATVSRVLTGRFWRGPAPRRGE